MPLQRFRNLIPLGTFACFSCRVANVWKLCPRRSRDQRGSTAVPEVRKTSKLPRGAFSLTTFFEQPKKVVIFILYFLSTFLQMIPFQKDFFQDDLDIFHISVQSHSPLLLHQHPFPIYFLHPLLIVSQIPHRFFY